MKILEILHLCLHRIEQYDEIPTHVDCSVPHLWRSVSVGSSRHEQCDDASIDEVTSVTIPGLQLHFMLSSVSYVPLI